jgi:hypothetical protein
MSKFIVAHHLSARQIANALPKGRKSGSGYVACCPAHEDKTPSLSLRDADDGTVLVYCFVGCSQRAVIDALRQRGLWPERERRWLSPAEWREQQQYAEKMRQEMREARFFAVAFEPLAELALEELPPIEEADWDIPDDVVTERIAITRALAELRIARESGALLQALYRDWRLRYPKLVAALVHAGVAREKRLVHRLWSYIHHASR